MLKNFFTQITNYHGYVAPHFPLSFPFETDVLLRHDLAVEPIHFGESSKKSSWSEQSRIRRTVGEVKLLIAIPQTRQEKKSRGHVGQWQNDLSPIAKKSMILSAISRRKIAATK